MTTAAAASGKRWLYGPFPDLLLGCGLWYALAFVALATAGAQIRTGGAAVVLPFLVLALGTPHYGATLVRVYQRRVDRRAYTLFAVHASVLIALAFVAGVYDVGVGSWIVTVYLTWSPWHYTGQNYGIGVMFLRRRGVAVTPGLKRFVYAAFVCSYVLLFLALHSGSEASDYSPVVAYDPDTYHFQSLGLPAGPANLAFLVVLAGYLFAVAGSVVLLLRRSSLRDSAPTLALMAIQALWFSIPLVLRRWQVETGIEPWKDDFGSYYFTWIAIGHSVQYLWVTSFYAKAGSAWRGQLAYFAQVMVAGAAIWTLPALVFAPGVMGRLPYDSGLALLVAAAVNIHHFVLDGAIWKLRDGRIARILVRSRQQGGGAAGGGRERWAGRLVYVVGAACFLVMFTSKWERESLRRGLHQNDFARIEESMGRLARIGRESAKARILQAKALRKKGELTAAIFAYERSLELHPTAPAWIALANVHERQKNWQEAAAAYESALAIDPDRDLVLRQLGLARLKLDQPERARAAFERAIALNPERTLYQQLLDRADARIREHDAGSN